MKNEEQIKIELDYKFENLNDMINLSRGSKFKANIHKQKEMQYIRLATMRVPKITEYPIKMIFIWHVKDKNRDIDNLVGKNIIDGLVKARILKNDNLNCINEITYKYVIDNSPKLELIMAKN